MSDLQVVVTSAALNALLEARLAGLAVATGSPNVVSLEQYGSFVNGVADASLDVPAMNAAMATLASLGGGTLQLYQNYSINTSIEMDDDSYSNIAIVGMRPGAGFTRPGDAATNTNGTILRFVGATAYSLKNIRLQGVTFSGHSANDYTKLVTFGHCDGVYVDNCRFFNNAVEGLYFEAPRYCRNATVTNCKAKNVGMDGAHGVAYLSAYNMNVDNSLLAFCEATACGLAIEQTGRNARIVGNDIDSCVYAGIQVASTWASWIDAGDNTTVHSSNNILVAVNTVRNQSIAIYAADYVGHTDTTGTPTIVPGNAGDITVALNNLYNCNLLFDGGADSLGQVVIRENYVKGAFDDQNPAVRVKKGRATIEDNVFCAGAVLWSELMRVGVEDPVNTSAVVRGNTAVGKGWGGAAYILGPTTTLLANIFENVPPDVSAYYTFVGPNYLADAVPVSQWTLGTDAWLVQTDPEFCYSPTQQSRLRVNGAPPAKGTWKVGDRVDNISTSGVAGWRCALAGTGDTITAGVTASTTSGSASVTITANTSKILQYQWITIAGVTGRYQLTAFNPLTGVGTIAPPAATTVVSAAVAFSHPTWEIVGVKATKAVSGAYTVTSLDELIFYSTPTAYAIALPPASLSEGHIVRFAKSDASANALTITAAGADTINGAGTFAPVQTQYQITHVYCMGGAWYAHDDGVTGGGGGAVSTVFGRSGAVTAQSNDYSYAQLASKPTTIAGISSGVATDFVTQLEATGDARYIQIGATISDATITDSPFFTITSPGATPSAVWTAAHRQQVMTLTTNATVTVSAIPAGGALLLRVIQAASGGPYTLSHAVSGLGTLIPDGGGGAPTMSTGASKYDDYLYRFDGTGASLTRIFTGGS